MFTTCRSVKDTLESSLFEAQQQLSHLEITKSQLEIQLHTVIQAKEVIQGESLMYFASVVHLQCSAEKWRKWRESPFVLKLKWRKASKYRIVSVGTAFLPFTMFAGEVKCLQYELETERCLMKQEQQNMAQRLIQIEEQHNNTLKLQQTDHEVEINKLLQDLVGNNMFLILQVSSVGWLLPECEKWQYRLSEATHC